ncbi:MAG: alpha/beta hydrolase [Flavobacteriales bacterium]|nr:alpha/beta hydrolase [Flavobacteriales bacterium]
MEYQIHSDGDFEYIEEGEGQVILVLHGLFGALSNFADVINDFKENYKVIVPLLPIYTSPLLSTNVGSLAKFVRSFVEHKKLGKVTLLGNSLGGHIALVYTKRHMEDVEALVLTGSSGLYEDAMGGTFPRRENYEFVKEKVKQTFYDPEVGTKELVDECYEIVNNRTKVLRVIALAKSAIGHNMAKDLPSFNIPSCLIWGKHDTITPPKVAEEFHKLLPDSNLIWIDKCGHAPMMEHPKEFNSKLITWLEERFPKSV